MYYVLCNPLSANNQGALLTQVLVEKLSRDDLKFVDVRTIEDYSAFWKNVDLATDVVILTGGDGTLNRFVNSNHGLELPQNLYYYAAGSGNDFRKDVVNDSMELIPLREYIKDLPVVYVNGKEYFFVNGVGFGIDGYCCEEGDALKAKSDKPVNYTAIAIKGLLFFFKPANARITVDGVTKEYKKVWIAPTMKGRYYGGGMKVTPDQDRNDPEGKVSVALLHGTGKIKTLMIFPSIFEGEHVKHTKHVEVCRGHEITVEFDRPMTLQIDGETVFNVSTYTVKTHKNVQKEAAEALK